MMDNGFWSEEEETKLLEEVSAWVEEEVQQAENINPPDIKDIFQYMYAEMDADLQEQYEDLKKFQTKESE